VHVRLSPSTYWRPCEYLIVPKRDPYPVHLSPSHFITLMIEQAQYAADTFLARYGSSQHVTAHRIYVCKYFADLVIYGAEPQELWCCLMSYISNYTDCKLFGLPGNLFTLLRTL
jgi:hypothetical protein